MTTDSEFSSIVICNQESSLGCCEGFMSSILSSYFLGKVFVEAQEQESAPVPESLNWLKFQFNQKKFSIALNSEWDSAAGLQALLEWLHNDEKRGFKMPYSFRLEGAEIYKSNSSERNFLKFKCKKGKEVFSSWLASEPNSELPKLPIHAESKWDVKMPISIDLGVGQIVGDLSILRPQLVLKPSSILTNSDTKFYAKLEATTVSQILKIKEDPMHGNNPSLRTSLRLGALEMKLDDFLSLRPGTNLKFRLPDKMPVELEIGGSVVGRAELRVSEESFELIVSEIASSGI
jgi:flagellar motor switch/type III secretory pathway protein FliN